MPDLDLGSEGHPIGTIVMWSGLLTTIPSGWLLCDGTLGTPDLIQFFARGSPPSTEPGTENGEDFHVLSSAEMPSHAHSVSGLGHRHNQELSSVAIAGGSTGLQGNSNAGLYTFNNENAGGSFGSSGSNQQHENKPPFFELAFIQRVT